jgi:hypothetical protein
LGAELLGELCAQDLLRPVGVHAPAEHLCHDQHILETPSFRSNAEQRELQRQVGAEPVRAGIEASGVCSHELAFARAVASPCGGRRLLHAECAEELVPIERACAEDLREPAAAHATEKLQTAQAVLGMHETEAKDRVSLVASADVRNALAVTNDLDPLAKARYSRDGLRWRRVGRRNRGADSNKEGKTLETHWVLSGGGDDESLDLLPRSARKQYDFGALCGATRSYVTGYGVVGLRPDPYGKG